MKRLIKRGKTKEIDGVKLTAVLALIQWGKSAQYDLATFAETEDGVALFGHRVVSFKSESYPEASKMSESLAKIEKMFEVREKVIEEGFIQESFEESWGHKAIGKSSVFERDNDFDLLKSRIKAQDNGSQDLEDFLNCHSELENLRLEFSDSAV